MTPDVLHSARECSDIVDLEMTPRAIKLMRPGENAVRGNPCRCCTCQQDKATAPSRNSPLSKKALNVKSMLHSRKQTPEKVVLSDEVGSRYDFCGMSPKAGKTSFKACDFSLESEDWEMHSSDCLDWDVIFSFSLFENFAAVWRIFVLVSVVAALCVNVAWLCDFCSYDC